MTKEEGKEIKRATVGIFCDEVDLVKSGETKQVRSVLFDLINARRGSMDKLDPVSCMLVRGGTEQLRSANALMLKTASEAALFRLSHDDPHSDTATYMKERSGGKEQDTDGRA